jgi:hypothetical protein
MDDDAIARAQERLSNRLQVSDLEGALERARDQLEAFAAATAELETALPGRVEDAVRDGIRDQVLPVGRQLAEVRGLLNQVLRRLERLDSDLTAERHARVDDLALLVDLIASGWRGVEQRLARLEERDSQDSLAESRLAS